MRFFLIILLLIAVCICMIQCSAERSPNFILIMADDLGYGDLGCYGSNRIQTPNIDKLAEEGLLFTDYHSNGAVCTPTRAALMTGRYQQRAHLEGVITVAPHSRIHGMDVDETTFAEVLQSAGYATGIFGKWHLGYDKQYNPVHQGFDEFRGYVSGNVDYISHYDNSGVYDWWHNLEQVEEDGYSTDLITEHAVNFIKTHQHKPFCLYVAHEAPHWPYQGRDSKADRFEGSDHDARGSSAQPLADFIEMIEVMDEGIGSIMETVDSLGLSQNTFVFFCSDNGGDPPYGDNGDLRGHKGQLWEGGHRVPAVAWWPGVIDPGTTDQLAMSMDVFPTLLNLAGISSADTLDFDGIDLSPALLHNDSLAQRAVFRRYRNDKAVRKGPWKVVVDGERSTLFNLDYDRGETRDLSKDYPEQKVDLLKRLAEWERDVPPVEDQKVR